MPPINHILDTIEQQLHVVDIDLNKYKIDHICYRCESDEHYDEMLTKLAGIATLLHDTTIDDRQVSIRKCKEPLQYEGYTIPCIELSAPKKNNTHRNGREHIEVVVDDLEIFDKQYGHHITERKGFIKPINRDLEIEFPGCNTNGGQYAIKFHEQSIEEVVQQEKI